MPLSKRLKKKKEKTVKVSFNILEEDLDCLIFIANQEETNFSDIIRRAVEMYLISQTEILGSMEIEKGREWVDKNKKRWLLINGTRSVVHQIKNNPELSPAFKKQQQTNLEEILGEPESLFRELNPEKYHPSL